MMASPPEMNKTKDEGVEPLKKHIQNWQDLLVEALYNIAPLLDHMIAAHLLTQENYFDVQAEKTPQNKARKLLEVVQHQMDEEKALHFIECLKKCKEHYPRLKDWLTTDAGIKRGPTEQKLRKQMSELCLRLGHLVTPISMRLFSGGTLSQFELEQVQASTTPFLQNKTLLSLCLAKGEKTCLSFYQAFHSEDSMLAKDIDECSSSSSLKNWDCTFNPVQSEAGFQAPTGSLDFSVGHPVPVVSRPFESLPPLTTASVASLSSCSTAVEETHPLSAQLQDLTLKMEYGGEIELRPEEKELIREVTRLLGLELGSGMTLNLCELGLALGLPRGVVRESLFELESAGDLTQLAAIVHCFMEKTQDQNRLLHKIGACNTKRLMLSERGRLLLALLQEVTADINSSFEDVLQKCRHLFHFVMRDCFAEVEEDPSGASWTGPLATVRLLKENVLVDRAVIQELEDCWGEETAESYQQSLRILAQLLRDLFPLLDSVEFDGNLQGEIYRCKPRRLHRVTKFKGLPPRIIYRVLTRKGAHSVSKDATGSVSRTAVTRQYKDICLKVANLLAKVSTEGNSKDLMQAEISDIIREIQLTLSKPEFTYDSFDAGIKLRLLSLVEFDPIALDIPALITLHWNTVSILAKYLKTSDRHAFQFNIEYVRMQQCLASLQGICSVRDPVTIDNGVEEVFCFLTSGPALFLVCLHCRGYRDGKYFMCNEPLCFQVFGLPETAMQEVESLGGKVLTVEKGKMWLREDCQEGLKTRLEAVSQSHSTLLQEGSCCFLVKSFSTECEVKFTFKNNKITATAEKNSEVL
ncbi:uncharacterized protein LOC117405954 isoform X1 [Acipenser ruthenus]|uniref:uncharacterized protein LOC117405954 isoform X1 n=1 Tax=Acipenser ruthenus TaxID=7906 RepID=UPI00156081E5|nr:uncharacterized protein LOC117405954 isoform X1 [Acipenser ruthenus]XP_034778819.1 uncharacterized protein LOC117972770 isoform X1 [Acipenser ruthenus]XP_058884387.1 uncharacterized protein LOC117972770 isoform X1 [Acipenser ruthenus]XP_058887054.1 uncharacterized protein LOC117405954 isoform X1 [Acipenser ruthenus]